jgi:hypothetical protein
VNFNRSAAKVTLPSYGPPKGFGLSGEQPLANELTRLCARRAGEQPTTIMRRELVEEVELRHRLVYLLEAAARITFIDDEERSGIVEHAVAPRWPTLCREAQSIIVRIAATENLCAVGGRRHAETHVGRLVSRARFSWVQVTPCSL